MIKIPSSCEIPTGPDASSKKRKRIRATPSSSSSSSSDDNSEETPNKSQETPNKSQETPKKSRRRRKRRRKQYDKSSSKKKETPKRFSLQHSSDLHKIARTKHEIARRKHEGIANNLANNLATTASPKIRFPSFKVPRSDLLTALKGLWDVENCPVASSLDVNVAYQNVVSTFIRFGFLLSCEAFHVDPFPKKMHQIPETAIKLTPLPKTEDDHEGEIVDMHIESQLLMWANEHDPPAPVALFAGDKDYLSTIQDLESLGYIVIVAYNQVTSETTQDSFSTAVSWESLAAGDFLDGAEVFALDKLLYDPRITQPNYSTPSVSENLMFKENVSGRFVDVSGCVLIQIHPNSCRYIFP